MTLSPYRSRRGLLTMGNYLDKNSRSLVHCADVRVDGAPLTRTPPRQSWGRGPSPLGVAANSGPLVDVCVFYSFTASCAQRRRVESLVLGALSSSPVHRSLVLVLGTNIAVLSDCSKSSRLDSVALFLTYLLTAQKKKKKKKCVTVLACFLLLLLLRAHVSVSLITSLRCRISFRYQPPP